MADAIPAAFHDALASLAERLGDGEAIVAPERKPLRFGELFRCVERTRTTLNRAGIGRGDRVVAALARGPEAAVCFFGVAACATYVPLDPDYTEDELCRYLAKLEPKAVIVSSGDAGAIRQAAHRLGIRVLEIHAGASGPAGTFDWRGADPAPCVAPQWAGAEDVALILLTSGTTAVPKFVPLKHRHLTALARAAQAHYGLGAADRLLHTMPMFHGNGLKSALVAPILSGSTVICPPRFDVPSFFECMSALRPTWYSASYTVQRAILDRIGEHRRIAADARLRFIVSGSGRIDAKVVRGLEAAFGAPVLNRYSMSETGMLACDPLPPGVRKPGTAGVCAGNELRVADERGRARPRGEEGEIQTRGPSVFEGYLDESVHDARSFVDGWFRTGDLGRIGDDGYVTITGRIKELINRGGEKIGPQEVERVIGEHPAVADVCVFAIAHPTLGEDVAAAVIPVDDVDASEQSIVEFARKRLAAFKVPRRVVFVHEFPKGTAGKIDRKRLAQACAPIALSSIERRHVPGDRVSSLERDVAALWRTILDAPNARSDVDFFLSGGDSLRLTELMVAIRQRFGVNVGMRQIFGEGATIAGLVHVVERALREKGRDEPLPERLVPIKIDGDRAALFAIPDSDGNASMFAHLGRLLDARQPLFGLESRGLDGTSAPLESVEAIAADHLSTIRMFQPQGPYFLVGACFGGRVAYELARQLESIQERVALLIMLDPSAPFTDSKGVPRGRAGMPAASRAWSLLPRFVARRLRMYVREIRRLDGAQRLAFVAGRLGLVREIIRRRDLFRGDRSELNRIVVYEANQAAGRRHVPKGPYAGPAIVALTNERADSQSRNLRLDWLDLIPECGPPQDFPGRDIGDLLVPPTVHAVAAAIDRWLDDAHAGEEERRVTETDRKRA